MKNQFLVEEGHYGPRLVLNSAWNPEVAAYMREQQISGLVINYARGWVGTDISFLSDVPFLTEFVIVDWKIKDITPIHFLSQARAVQVSTYCKTPLHFECFPELEDCGLTWREGSESLFDCKGLKRLFISDYTGRESTVFSGMAALQSLSISGGRLTCVGGLRGLKDLRFLGLYHLKQLAELSGIEALDCLEELEITDCRAVNQIDPVAGLINLRKLVLSNDGAISSLKPLLHLRRLEWVTFPESTNIVEGDLTPLLTLPRLRKVAFKNRRHYTHRREEIAAILAD